MKMQRIVDAFRSLNDSTVLTLSRTVSNFFNFSIARWAQRRSTLMYGNAITGVCSVSRLEIPAKHPTSPEYVPEMDEKALLGCLTLKDVRDLAQYEYPTMSNPTQI